jgi:hypothetical protein
LDKEQISDENIARMHTLIAALWDPQHRTQLSPSHILDPWKLWNNKHVLC